MKDTPLSDNPWPFIWRVFVGAPVAFTLLGISTLAQWIDNKSENGAIAINDWIQRAKQQGQK